MVKKSKLLDRIVDRFRSGSVKVDSSPDRTKPANRPSGGRTKKANGSTPAEPVARETAVPVKHVPEEIIPRSKRKLSSQEDAAMQMTKSFGELSSLLRGVQSRMENQGERLDNMDQNLNRLPAAAEAQLAVLQGLVGQLEKQNEMNATMVSTFSELPEVMKGVQESLAKSAVTDERTAQTLDEFKGTMNRIQSSMGDMVETSKVQADAASSLANNHEDTVRSLEKSTKEGLDSLRGVQEDQANRMTKLVGETGRWNRAVVVLLILSFAALVSIFGALITT